MSALLAVVVLLGAAWAARRLTYDTMDDRLAESIAATTAFFAIFLSAFFVQGYLELATQRPLVGLPLAAAFTALVVGATFMVRRRLPAGRRASHAATRMRPIPRLVVIVSVATVAIVTALLLAGLPRGYEVRAYHLPIAVRVLHDGTLGLWDHAFMHAYPANMSVWAGFFLEVLPERWVAIANLPFLALLCAATFASCRAVGGDRSAATVVTAGVATIPIFGFSAIEVGADVAGVAFVLVAALMIATRPASNTKRAIVAGAAAGLAFGFKSLNLVPIAVLGLVLVAQCVREWRADGTARSLLPVVWFTATALALMSFWLVRNGIEAGNPLYPVHLGRLFDLFGWKAAPGFDLASRIGNEKEWVASPRDWLAYPWVEGHAYKQNFKHSSGLGPFFAATVPVAIVLWPIHAARAIRAGATTPALRVQAVLYAVAVVVLAAWWVLGDRQPRYFMVAIATLAPIAALFVTSTSGRVRSAYEALLALCVVAMAVVLVVRLGVENGPFLLKQRGAARWQAMQYPHAVDTLPAGAIVGNGIDREQSYALLGDRFPNRVVDATETARVFAAPEGGLLVTREGVVALGLTHLYVASDTTLRTDDCVALREVDRLDRNPFNGQPIAPAGVLYAIESRCR